MEIKAFSGSLTITVADGADPSTVTVDLGGSGVELAKLGEAIAALVKRKFEVVAGLGRQRLVALEQDLAAKAHRVKELEAKVAGYEAPSAPPPLAPASEGVLATNETGLEQLDGKPRVKGSKR